ncbi:MAG: OmpA family protein [Candidatus Zhuqueibacterota bacterium]
MNMNELVTSEKLTESSATANYSNQKIDRLITLMLLEDACKLAHTGRYAEAENLLSEIKGDRSIELQKLDLLARIKAQQGRLPEAELLWKKAEQLDPENSVYRTALQTISNFQQRPSWLLWLGPVSVVVIICLVIIFLLWIFKLSLPKDNQDVSIALSKLASEQAKLGAQLSDLRKDVKPDSSTSAIAKISLSLPEISTTNNGTTLTIVFREGLFHHGATLTATAKDILIRVGRQLEQYRDTIQIVVIGFSDDIPMPNDQKYRDNVTLGWTRALSVVEWLRLNTALTAENFSTYSKGEVMPPFPNDSYRNKIRNRTVIIKVMDISTEKK